MKIGIIAVSPDGVIGDKKGLVWNIRDDKKLFQKNLSRFDSPVFLMGKNTYLHAEKLFQRIAKEKNGIIAVVSSTMSFPNTRTFTTLESALDYFKNENILILGGKDIYDKTFDLWDYALVSWVNEEVAQDSKSSLKIDINALTKKTNTMETYRLHFYYDFHYQEFKTSGTPNLPS